jgi:hypothetical protein
MKPFHFFLTIILILSCAACQRPAEPEAGHRHDTQTEESIFNPAKGLALGAKAREAIGLEIREVGLSKVESTLTASAQVFRLPSEAGTSRYRSGHAYAVARIPVARGKLWRDGRELTLRDKSGRTIPARLQRVDAQMSEVSGQVEWILEIPELPEDVSLGTFLDLEGADAEVPGGEVMAVPVAALLDTAKGTFVYVENDGFYLRTPVTRGRSGEGWVELVDGIFEGDRVVVKGARDLYLTELQAVNAGTGCAHGH